MNQAPDNFDEVRKLFHQLCDAPPAARHERLASIVDDSLRRELASLLQCAEAQCRPIDEAPARIAELIDDIAGSREQAAADTLINDGDAPARIGNYELTELLGQGGMGVVYRAVQRTPIHREVAIKLVRPGMATRAMLARFEAERQTLASMSHPNIASVYDAGVTDDGRPYFVMQYVPGLPITQFCDEHRLDLEKRLSLFMAICDAVHHAHRRGVIHRDLKPSNVLVRLVDGAPTAHVIDFGIAKALRADVADPISDTAPGVLLGAPLYMSPEQAEHDHPVDTRSDVYSLGVMLYELLCGDTPVPAQRLRARPPSRAPEFIRTYDPHTPSRSFLAQSDQRREEIAARRRMSPRHLSGALRGELDWIVMKSIARAPVDRYDSPVDLAADIRRRTRREPVKAGPPRLRYRAGRFFARHRFPSIAAAVVLLAALTGIAGVLWQSRRTQIEMRNAQQVSQFLHNVLASNDPWRTGETLTLREVLDQAAIRLRDDADLTPLTRARLHNTLGATYWGLGDVAQAQAHFDASLNDFRTARGEFDAEAIGVMANQSLILHRLGRSDEGEAMARLALRMAQAHPKQSPLLASLLTNIATIASDCGREDEAEALYREVLAIERARQDDREITHVLANLGAILIRQEKFAEATTIIEEALQRARAAHGDDPRVMLPVLSNAAALRLNTDRPDDAVVMFKEAAELGRRALGADHPDTIKLTGRVILGLIRARQLAEAEALARMTIQHSESRLGPSHDQTLTLIEYLIVAVGFQERFDECLAFAIPWFESFRDSRGESDPVTRRAAKLVAEIYDSMGDAERTKEWRLRAGETVEMTTEETAGASFTPSTPAPPP